MARPPPPPGWVPPAEAEKPVPPPPPAFKIAKTSGSQQPRANGPAGSRRKRKRPMRDLESPERLRSIMARHSNMGPGAANLDKHAYVGALKYLPHAVYKLLENMPQPWEASKPVRVLYHVTGAVTFVDEIPWVNQREYTAQWGEAWSQMRDEKRDRTRFRRMRLPPFDDEEPPVSWKDLASLVPEWPDAVPMHAFPTDFTALRAAEPYIMNQDPPAIFNLDSFFTSKALGEQLPNGPSFEPPQIEAPLDPDSFDDPSRLIIRPRQSPVRVETRVAFPELYNSRAVLPKDVSPPQYKFPVNAVIVRKDNKRAFFVDNSITPPTHAVGAARKEATDRGTVDALDNVVPFLADAQIDEQQIAECIACYHAPYPFNQVADQRRRAEDVALVKAMFTKRRPLRVMKPKTRRSYQRLLKHVVKQKLVTQKSHKAAGASANSVLKVLAGTKFFERTKVEWLEAGLQLCQQGYQILQLLIHKRGLHFLHLDYNFNLKPTKTLTTKERKRSRFGNSFHQIREQLKLVKMIVDAHVQFRLKNIDAFELADGLHYIFTHVGQLTGLYRYKYKVMHQITMCKDLKHVIYDRFNRDGVGKGPGCGIWQPSWRVWLGFLRGNIPMLERWLSNLITRQFHGRVSKGVAKTVTKQRVDSQYDLELRAAVMHDILDAMPEGLRQAKTKVIMQHLSEAWRSWKANIPWEVPGMPAPVQRIIDRYVAARSDHWVKVTHLNRERIRAGATVDKAVARKNLGRLTRLWLRNEQERQLHYLSNGPFIDPADAVLMYKTMASYLQAIHFEGVIPFPESGYPHDSKLLTLALENLREGFSMAARLNHSEKEAIAMIDRAYDNPHEALTKIKQHLLNQRVFKDISISLLDFYSHVSPVYMVDPAEKIVDAYLDQYLWFEAEKRGLFPRWVKPSDDEVPPIMLRKICTSINALPNFWETENDETSAIMHLKLERFVENVDFTLLKQLLRLVVDPILADYITAKMNASLSYKDMSHINQIGIIRGLQFSSFVVQYYLLMVDLLILGLPRALELRKEGVHASAEVSEHPIQSYYRYIDESFVVMRLTRDEANDLSEEYATSGVTLLDEYPLKRTWPHDKMMRLIRRDLQVGRSLFFELKSRIPEVLGNIKCLDASVYSMDNPALLFDLGGFEVRLEPKSRMFEEGLSIEEDSMWNLADPITQERTGVAMLRVSKESIDRFRNRVRQILMSSGSTTFQKIIKRWNTALTALATYFREAAIATPELLDVIVKCETKIQNKVKMGLNSKMPARFPPCVFYSPEELGGLGMLSASHILIPSSDLRGVSTRFNFGMTEADDSLIPNVFRYITSWDSEVADSLRVWSEYAMKRAEASETNSRISLEDLEDIWSRGLPRISTLFQKDRHTLAVDKGFRARQEFRVYANEKYDPFWWTNSRHDGRLWNFTAYRTDVIEALGGIQAILEHSLFKATGFEDWEGLFWQKQSGFEQQMQMQKLTNAQRSGLSQIPNRRFTLWWSPTINRANVYIGFLVQLDLTGIFLHGKIPTLKISYIQVFRAHLWQKIHESLVVDLCQVLDRESAILHIDSVQKLPIHPRKSYRMNASTADVLITSMAIGVGWPMSKPSLLDADDNNFEHATGAEFWIDIQLRYGDYDSHDISRYTRAKFLDYTNDDVSVYPSRTGLMICVDLAYNTYSAYGYWFPGLKKLVRQAMKKIMQSNPGLYILRERIRKALQLYQSQPKQPHLTAANFMDLMGGRNLVVDDSAVYRVVTHRTKNGNSTAKPINGALITLDPVTGQLSLQVIHAATAWAGQKRLSAVSKWKAAEELASLLRSTPKEEMPEQVIIATRGLRDPMEVNLLEFPGITVRNSDVGLPFKALLTLPRFATLVDDATEPQLSVFNLYDNWLTISQPSTAFSRVILLLRALLVDPEEAMLVLKRRGKPQEGHVWPTLSREDWIDVEAEMSDLVLRDYSRKAGVNVKSLTQSEIRDIILGQSITPPSQERQAIALSAESDPSEPKTAVTRKTHNVHGDEITVVTSSRYEQQTFNSRNTWRNRALAASSALHYATDNLIVSPPSGLASSRCIVPQGLLKAFVGASDVQNMVIGVLYGSRAGSDVEVKSVALLPQLGSQTTVSFSPIPGPMDLQFSAGLSVIGIVRTQPNARDSTSISPIDLTVLGARLAELQNLAGNKEGRGDTLMPELVVLNLNYDKGSVKVSAYEPTAEGLNWGATNQDLLSSEPQGYDAARFAHSAEVVLDPSRPGFFFVPEDEIWNYAFMSTLWNAKLKAFMTVGLPLEYYDGLHRPHHFSQVTKLEESYNPESLDIDTELI